MWGIRGACSPPFFFFFGQQSCFNLFGVGEVHTEAYLTQAAQGSWSANLELLLSSHCFTCTYSSKLPSHQISATCCSYSTVVMTGSHRLSKPPVQFSTCHHTQTNIAEYRLPPLHSTCVMLIPPSYHLHNVCTTLAPHLCYTISPFCHTKHP